MRTVRVRVATADGVFNTVDRVLVDSEQFKRDMVLEMDWLSDGSAVVLYRVRGGSATELEARLDRNDAIVHVDVLDDDRNGAHTVFVRIEPESPMSELISLVDRHGLLINRPIVLTDEGVELQVAGSESSLRSAMTELPDDVEFSIEDASTDPPTDRSLRSRLTDRQREAVRVALALGYYETPRRATYEDIATELDCAPSTANELLRRAETTLVTAVFSQ